MESTEEEHSHISNICDQCGKGFSNVYTLSSHKRTVHDSIKDFACYICNARFATSYKLRRHHLGVHSEKRDYHCKCGQSFKTRDMLIKHQRTHFQGPFACSICDEVFKFKSGLDHHERLKHTAKPAKPKEQKEKSLSFYECSYCKKLFKSLKVLNRHEDHHERLKETVSRNSKPKQDNSGFNYCCSYCLKQYKSKSNFEIHIASHEVGNDLEDYGYVIEELVENDEMEEIDENQEPDDDHDEMLFETDELDSELVPDELLKNIDSDIVSIVKIETERFVDAMSEADENAENDLDDNIICEETIEDVDYFNEDPEEENFIIEADDDADFYETISVEELQSPSVGEVDVITQGVDFLVPDSVQDEQPSEVHEKKIKSQRTKTSLMESQSVCDVCGASYKNNSHLKRHIQRKHMQDSHRLECDVCGKKFLLNYDLRRHMVKHSSVREFSCQLCDQKFKTELTLRNHAKALHNPDLKLERNFRCKLCGRSYFHQRHLDYHLRKHDGDHRYKCEICVPEKGFYYSDAVKWHKIRHHNEPAPFNCGICSKKFIHGKSLRTHEKEHQLSGSLAVKCEICGKSVSERRHLKRHMRGHGDKNFKCACGSQFKERHQLTK